MRIQIFMASHIRTRQKYVGVTDPSNIIRIVRRHCAHNLTASLIRKMPNDWVRWDREATDRLRRLIADGTINPNNHKRSDIIAINRKHFNKYFGSGNNRVDVVVRRLVKKLREYNVGASYDGARKRDQTG